MRNKYSQKIKGLTLIETMVVIAIIGILSSSIIGVLLIGESSWHSGEAQIQVSQEGRRGLSSMVRELRQTRSSTITTVPADDNYYNSIAFSIPSDTDGDGDAIDPSGNIEWSVPIRYSLNNNQLLRTSGATTVLANNVSALQFRRQSISPDILEISLQTQKTTTEQRVIRLSLTSKIKMRN